jgi:hypothetical protein
MWDKRVVEKVEECGRLCLLFALSKMSMIILSGLLHVFMALMLTLTEECTRTNWWGLAELIVAHWGCFQHHPLCE